MPAAPPPRGPELLWGQPSPVGTGDLSSSLCWPAVSASTLDSEGERGGQSWVNTEGDYTTRRSGEEGDGTRER